MKGAYGLHVKFHLLNSVEWEVETSRENRDRRGAFLNQFTPSRWEWTLSKLKDKNFNEYILMDIFLF